MGVCLSVDNQPLQNSGDEGAGDPPSVSITPGSPVHTTSPEGLPCWSAVGSASAVPRAPSALAASCKTPRSRTVSFQRAVVTISPSVGGDAGTMPSSSADASCAGAGTQHETDDMSSQLGSSSFPGAASLRNKSAASYHDADCFLVELGAAMLTNLQENPRYKTAHALHPQSRSAVPSQMKMLLIRNALSSPR